MRRSLKRCRAFCFLDGELMMHILSLFGQWVPLVSVYFEQEGNLYIDRKPSVAMTNRRWQVLTSKKEHHVCITFK